MSYQRYIITLLLLLIFLPTAVCAKQTHPQTHKTKKISHQNKKTHVVARSYTQNDANQEINNILTRFNEDINIGIMVKNLKTNQIIYAKNANRYFVPASNQKVLTAYTALNLLGPNFTFKTTLYTDHNKINNGVLNDNVTLKFRGDPELTFAHLDALIKTLTQAGIQKINGKLIIDDSDFDYNFWPPGTAYDDRLACFGAPISTVIINRNCLGFQLAANGANKSINVVGAASQLININNELSLGSKGCAPQLQSQAENNYILSGCMRGGSRLNVGVVIQNPHLYAEKVLIYLLKKNQLAVTQGVQFGIVNPQTPILAEHQSRSLNELVTRMLKRSDNIIANSLFKTIGFVYNHTQSTWENSGHAMQNIISQNVGIKFADQAFIDGAGLSRYNHVTPAQMIAILQRAYQQYTMIPVAITGLPIAGIDGTLAGRMSSVARRVWAKTGSENSVCSLSGYVFTRDNEPLSFSILINGFVGPLHKYRLLEDNICIVLANINKP